MSASDLSAPVRYLDSHPEPAVLKSEGQGWRGLDVNWDRFRPFKRNTFCYKEHLLCINVGQTARLEHAAHR